MYEATVHLGANTERGRTEAFAEAMRQVLVQVTGRTEAALEPALAPLVEQAARYVQLYRQLPGSMLLVSFDARRIERLLAAADPSQVRTLTLAVEGIAGLTAYAEVTRHLESLLVLRQLQVTQLTADTVLYRAEAREEPRQLAQAIEQMPGLRPLSPGTLPAAGEVQVGAVLRYRYSP